jgi:polar amino acid transport system ATP-binding protein
MNAIADMPSSASNAAFDTPPGAPLIEVRGLKKRFGEVEVLRGVDLEIARSEVVCIIGPSGSGKSTLLRCLAALETYDQGAIASAMENACERRRTRSIACGATSAWCFSNSICGRT